MFQISKYLSSLLNLLCRLSGLTSFMEAETGQAASARMQVEQEADGDQCSSRLSCARVQSKKGALYDICGMLGVVCSHGFPLAEGFCDLRGPENFVYLVLPGTKLSWQTLVCVACGACKERKKNDATVTLFGFPCRLF